MASSIYPGMQFKLQETIYDSKSMLDEQNFYHQRQGGPENLTDKITYLIGSKSNRYPLTTMTLGGSAYGMKGTTKEIQDVQYNYPVMGHQIKVSTISETPYSGSDKPGIQNGEFYLTFADNWIKRYYIIQSQNQYQAYVVGDPDPVINGFRYKCVLDPAGPTDFLPIAECAVGSTWVMINSQVAESQSRTTESNMVAPGMFKNQLGFLRTGISWAGNATEKIMKVVATNQEGKSSNIWMDMALWQMEKQWMEAQENYFWYSKYNRSADGTVSLKDAFTGKAITRGSGVLEQITNKSTYAKLNWNTLVNKVGDALFGMNDTEDMSITLMGGTGARRELDRCIREAGGIFLGNYQGAADKFITGSNNELMLGGYFTGFYHIDGYTIKFKYNSMFDTGAVAMNSPKHPESGLPLESYRMVFIDDSMQDGEANIIRVSQKGRPYIDGIVKGLTNVPKGLQIMGGTTGLEGSKFLSTDMDESSYVRLASVGIQIRRANRCFDLQCIAS
jgi:hypothetical protein